MASRNVRTAASEARLGKLHDGVTKLMQLKVDAILHALEVEELPDGTKFSALNSIDLKEISHIAQWLDKNDIGPSIDVQRTEEGDTPLQAKLKRLRAQAKGGRNDEEPPSVLEG